MADKLSLMQLPTEIISQIFLHCLPWMSSPQIWSDPFRLAPTFDPRNAPLLLIHVCRQWRLVAETTPILWTRLPTIRSTESKALELYKMYIRNSGEAPLWMHLTAASGAVGQEAADILVAHSHRWKHLSLSFQTHWGDASVKISNLPTHLPSLKYLHLQHNYLSSLDEWNLNRLPELITPRLRSLRIPSSKVLGLNLPWSQLTHYSGKFDRWQDAQAFLSLCTNLEVLDLHNPNQSFHALSEVSPPTHLPRLRDLSLVNEQVRLNYYHSLLDCLVLPGLETVCIGVDQDHSILEALCRCVARSSLGGAPRLRSVEVRCSQTLGVNQRSLRELSFIAPGIQELKITRPCPGALSAMRFHPTNAFLFPCLQHLTLIHPHLRDYELADIIRSRCHPPPSDLYPCTRLRHVEVMLMEEPAPEYLSMKRYKMKRRGAIQPLHEEFQDVAECFTDDPDFRQMYKKLKRILVVCKLYPGSRSYELPSHWGKRELVDPLPRFLEFSDAVFKFFENYEVRHPLLLVRHQAALRLREFVRGDLGADGLLRTHPLGFMGRASALLEKWQPMIDEYSKKDRWVIDTVETYSPAWRARAYTPKLVYRVLG